MRLNELERHGFISRAEQSRKYTKWQLTPKGAGVLPALLTLIHFGSKWNVSSLSRGNPFDTLGSTFEISYLAETSRKGHGIA